MLLVAGVAGAIACVGAYWALTRTSAANGILRAQLEEAFNEQYHGRLLIGALEGTPATSLHAHNVRLYDDGGRLVLDVDSVTASLSWRSLLASDITVDAATLYGPNLALTRLPGGRWNLQQVLRRRTASPPSGWRLRIRRLDVRDGSLQTTSHVAAPPLVRAGHLFDYSNMTVPHVSMTAALDAGDEGMRLTLHRLRAALPAAATHVRARGQLRLDGASLRLEEILLQTDASVVRGYATVRSSGGADPTRTVELSIDNSTLAFDEWRAVFPRLPLRQTADVALAAHGTLEHLQIDSLLIRRGEAQLLATGQVHDAGIKSLPHSFQGRVLAEGPSPDPLLALLGDSLRPAAPSAPFSVDLRVNGRRDDDVLYVSGEVDGRILGGHVEGSYQGQKRPGRALTYHAQVSSPGVDLGGLTPGLPSPAYVSGAVSIRSEVGRAQRPTIDARLQGAALQAAGIETLDLHVQPQPGRHRTSRVRVSARQAHGGRLQASLTVADGPHGLRTRGLVRTDRFDAGPLLGIDSLSTRIDARSTVAGSARNLRELQTHLQVKLGASSIAHGGRVHPLAPGIMTLDVRTAPTASQLTIGGDLLSGRLDGRFTLPSLARMTRHWYQQVGSSIAGALEKPLPGTAPAAAEAEHAPRRFAVTPEDSVHVRGRLRLLREDAVRMFAPAAPLHLAGAVATFDVQAGPSSYAVEAGIRGDTLAWSGAGSPRLSDLLAQSVTMGAFRGNLQSTGSRMLDDAVGHERVEERARPSEMTRSRWEFQFSSDSVRMGDASLGALHIESSLRDGRGSLSVHTGGRQHGPLQLEAGISLLPDRNRLTFTQLVLSRDDYIWRQEGTSRLELYSNGVVVPGLTLVRRHGAGRGPRVTLRGTLSEQPEDTLAIQADRLSVATLAGLVPGSPPLAGRLHGQLAYTGGLEQPEVTGRVTVANASFEGHLLGDLDFRSRYAGDSSAVAVEIAMRAAADPDLTQLEKRRAPLRFRAGGRMQLPDLFGSSGQPGALDLTVDIERGDVFFLNYPPFSKVVAGADGFFEGSLAITGSLRRPVLKGALRLAPTTFEVPKFNLQYTAQGPFTVDHRGLHVSRFRVRDEGEGTAVVAGDLLFNDYEFISFDLEASLEDLLVMDVASAHDLPFFGEIWGSGEFTLEGPFHQALLRSTNARTHPNSQIYIPLEASHADASDGFIRFRAPASDSTGRASSGPVAKDGAQFLRGLALDLNIAARRGTTVHLVMDPLLGETISARGNGRLQLVRDEGQLTSYGTLNVAGGEYLFSAGELFMRRLLIEQGGTITWDGELTNPLVDLTAIYKTRASTAGLFYAAGRPETLPLVVYLRLADRLRTPQLQVQMAIDRSSSAFTTQYAGLEAQLNQPEYVAEYATSVLLTNSFLLTTSRPQSQEGDLAETRNQLAFNSLSQLVTGQLNRYLSDVIPNLQLNLGVQRRSVDELGLSYGLALRLLDERLIIRGSGTYQNEDASGERRAMEGELTVEVRLHPNVAVQVYYRREGDLLESMLTNTAGAGLTYRTEFHTWKAFLRRIVGWLLPEEQAPSSSAVAGVGADTTGS